MRRLLQQHQRIRTYASAVPTAADFQSFHPASSPAPAGPSASPSAESVAKTLAAQAESQTKQAERTLKRFWKDVTLSQDSADGSWSVLLDKRILKTPSGKKLALPAEKRAAALVIAHEWDSQNKLLKPHSLPMVRSHLRNSMRSKEAESLASQTSLASRALDGLSDAPTRTQVIEVMNRYLHTDTVW